MTKLEYMISIADSAISCLQPIAIESDDDLAHAREVVRQTTDKAASYRREGWTNDDYRTLRQIVDESASIAVGL